jgi:hypothetical protein
MMGSTHTQILFSFQLFFGRYIDPVHNIVTRVTTLKILMGYDATVDTDAVS